MALLTPTLPSRWVLTSADTSDDPDIFPFLAGQSFLIQKSPLWATKIDQSVSGIERRRALWSYPIWQFKLGYEALRDSAALLELQRLITFFNSKSGSTSGFFYYDRFDNAVTASRFGTGDGSTTRFQLTRTTTIGGFTFTEPVRGFSGTPLIYKNGVATSAFTVDVLGQIVFTTAPASGVALTWTGQFFFMCRFEKDNLDGLGQVWSGVWALADLSFLTFKP